MGENLKFDYYYGIEAEQFSFYRVPRLLIKDARFKGLSSDAKLLYGLMLDRMELIKENIDYKQYKYLSDYDEKNAFDIEKYRKNLYKAHIKENDMVDDYEDAGVIQ